MLIRTSTLAQVRVEVSGVGLSQIPVAVTEFKGQDKIPQSIANVIKADLERSGSMLALDTKGIVADDASKPDFGFWRQKGADVLAAGSVTSLPDGRFELRIGLWDVVKGLDIGGKKLTVSPGDLRLAAHQLANHVYEKLTGESGIFASQIAYITKAGSRYTLWVADADGLGAAAALTSNEPIISPSWSPKGGQLAYVSFEARKPVVYTHRVSDGQRQTVANFKGSNSAPAWSRDGGQIALTLSRDGGSQIFLMNADGSGLKRLSQSSAIDTEAAFSADGQQLYFVSDRGGSPQIYRMALTGGSAERVTFTGTYNTSPALSADGKTMAYISRLAGNIFRLHSMDLSSGAITSLTNSGWDERPSFSPNGKLLLFTTREGGKSVLMSVTLDGKVVSRLQTADGEVRQAAWAKTFQ